MKVVDVIIPIFVALAWYAWNKYLKPWLVENRLMDAAQVAVAAAEAIYGRYHGQEKYKEAMEQLKAKGWDIDADEVINAVKAAWKNLDLTQKEAGEKSE